MPNVTIHDLINNVKKYDPDNVDKIKKAYAVATTFHEGQYRASGEPYIIHPLNVAYILSEMHADSDTICAGLLHDTIEDTNMDRESIVKIFNEEVAKLVDGVTKISNIHFSSDQDSEDANSRKLITGIVEDVRIIIIKLADKLHNMRTLQYKPPLKQISTAKETMDIFVPLANYIGAYRVKNELEDLSLKYLYPEEYERTRQLMTSDERNSSSCLETVLEKVDTILTNRNIPHEIKVRTKNVYGVYKKLHEGCRMEDIHDFLSLKIMVRDIMDCYKALGLIHSLYNPLQEKFRDYIHNPKTNMYRSIHTTIFGEDDRFVQMQIRTFDMDKVASFGLPAYWYINEKDARRAMQEELKNKCQFYDSLVEINDMFSDNQAFIEQVERELFSGNIYCYTTKGDSVELPNGSNAIDFAYKIHSDIGNKMTGAIVNDNYVDPEYVLRNKDRVRIITAEDASPSQIWLNSVKTARAKRKIREYYRTIKQ